MRIRYLYSACKCGSYKECAHSYPVHSHTSRSLLQSFPITAMFATLCIWINSHMMLWLLDFIRHRCAFRPEAFRGNIITSSHLRLIVFLDKTESCHLRWVWGSHLSEYFAPLAAVVALTAAVCIVLLPVAGFEKLAQRILRSCGLLSDITLHILCVCSPSQSGTQSACAG
jgi:hypothetical protein